MSVRSVGGGNGNGYHGSSYSEDNADLKAERKAIQRESIKEGNESFKLSEKKKNIEAMR